MKYDKDILEVIKKLSEKLPKFPDGRINYSDSNSAPALVICVKYKDKILLLKRSNKVRAYKEKWNCVGGYLDELKPVREKVLEELREELKIDEKDISKIFFDKPYKFEDKEINKTWFVQPVLVELNKKPKIILDWENTEYKWIYPEELDHFNTVPELKKHLYEFLESIKTNK